MAIQWSLAALVTALGFSTAALAADGGVITQKTVSLALARDMAETAYDSCVKAGFKVSVTVVDRSGETIVAYRGDGSGPHTLENSRRKAYTARTFGLPTSEYATQLATNQARVAAQFLPNVIAIGGGLPIKVGTEVIAGIGVSGAPGADKDEACVKAALDKVADQLK